MAQTQSYKNHARFDPSFHFFLAPLALVLLIATIVMLFKDPSWGSVIRLLGGVWALAATFKIRLYALKVQDRVIRLEERLRLRDTLPTPIQARIGELNENQLIALRFASDGELADFVPRAANGKWSRKQIKEQIRVWRPDYWRV